MQLKRTHKEKQVDLHSSLNGIQNTNTFEGEIGKKNTLTPHMTDSAENLTRKCRFKIRTPKHISKTVHVFQQINIRMF